MSLPPGFQSWAAPLIESLLPLDQDSINQIIKVAATEQGGPEGAGRYLKVTRRHFLHRKFLDHN